MNKDYENNVINLSDYNPDEALKYVEERNRRYKLERRQMRRRQKVKDAENKAVAGVGVVVIGGTVLLSITLFSNILNHNFENNMLANTAGVVGLIVSGKFLNDNIKEILASFKYLCKRFIEKHIKITDKEVNLFIDEISPYIDEERPFVQGEVKPFKRK